MCRLKWVMEMKLFTLFLWSQLIELTQYIRHCWSPVWMILYTWSDEEMHEGPLALNLLHHARKTLLIRKLFRGNFTEENSIAVNVQLWCLTDSHIFLNFRSWVSCVPVTRFWLCTSWRRGRPEHDIKLAFFFNRPCMLMQSVLVLLIYLEPKYTAHDLAACRSMFIIKWVCNAPQVRPCTVMASPCSHRHPKGPQETFHWVASRLLLERYAVRRKPLLSPSIFCFWALVCLPSQRSSRQPSLRSRDQLSWWLCDFFAVLLCSILVFKGRSWKGTKEAAPRRLRWKTTPLKPWKGTFKRFACW